VKVNGAHLFIPRHPTIGCTTLSRVDHLAGLRVAAGRAPAACSVLSILVMWVTWWPHPCGPRGLNQIFRKPGIKYSETTERKRRILLLRLFRTRAKTLYPLWLWGPGASGPTGRPSLGRKRQTCASNLPRRTAHVRPRRSREAIEPRRRRFGGRGPRGSVETSLTRCQLRGPS